MKHSHGTSLKSTVALCAMLFVVPATAWAQDEASEGGLQDIVVTARRTSENLQDVPISVGAVDAQALQSRGIASLTDVRSAVSNVTISKTGVAGGNYISIRGITGTSIPNVNADSSIGLYIDGIYIARQQSAGSDIADLERVEVLRGPQGTLSGRNSAAGAINFITASPTGEFGVIAEGTIGNYQRYRGRLTVNTPDFGGLSGRFTYVHDENQGIIRNRAAGTVVDYGPEYGQFTAAKRSDALNSDVIMAKLRYDGVDNLVVDYKFDFTDQYEVFPALRVAGFPVGFFGVTAAGFYLTQPGGPPPELPGRPYDTFSTRLAPAHIRTWGHTLTASYDVSDAITLKSITGYRKLRTLQEGYNTGPIDSNTAVCFQCSIVKIRQNQLSQELQLLGQATGLKYILGGYFFREKAFGDNPYGFFQPQVYGAGNINPIDPAAFYTTGSRDRVNNKSYAVYGHVDYSILDNLELAVGARYTIDKRVAVDERPIFPAPVRGDVEYKRFNYDVALTYSFSRDVHLYSRYATGYQSGGIMKSVAFDPEDHKAIEVGVKSQFLDRKVRLNAAYFHTKIDGLQRALVDLRGLVIENYSTAKIDGVEVELLVAPARGLTLGANYGYNKLRSPSQDVASTPRTTLSFNAQYDTPELENGMYLSFRIDGDYRSEYYGLGSLNPQSRTADPNFQLPAEIWAGYPTQQAYMDDVIRSNLGGGYWMANARVSLNDISVGGAKARITAYVRNLTDVEGRNYNANNGLYMIGYERPMTYGLEFGLNF